MEIKSLSLDGAATIALPWIYLFHGFLTWFLLEDMIEVATKGEAMSGKIVRAEVDFGDKKIKFEGPKEFVEEMVAKYTIASKSQGKLSGDQYSTGGAIVAGPSSERDLISMKRPHGHHETVAVLAFALTESGTSVFTEEDIRRAYIRAGVRPPKVVAQALRDAKNKYEFVELAGERGRYRLTNHGDRVVRFDLPRPRSD